MTNSCTLLGNLTNNNTNYKKTTFITDFITKLDSKTKLCINRLKKSEGGKKRGGRGRF